MGTWGCQGQHAGHMKQITKIPETRSQQMEIVESIAMGIYMGANQTTSTLPGKEPRNRRNHREGV